MAAVSTVLTPHPNPGRAHLPSYRLLRQSPFRFASCQAKPLGGGASGDHTNECGVSFEHQRSLGRHGDFHRACRRRGKPRRKSPDIRCRLPKARRSGIHALHGSRPCCHPRWRAELAPIPPGAAGRRRPGFLNAAGRSLAGGRSNIGPPPSGRLEQVFSLRSWYGSRTRDSQIYGLVLYH